MNAATSAVSDFFKRWFHKRNIIIISDRKVKHLPISGYLQFCLAVTLLTSISWASYSTGSFMAARSALKKQTRALNTVTNAHIESNFNTVYHPQTVASTGDMTPYKQEAGAFATNSVSPLSSLDNVKLMEKIALLEHKVTELKHTNEAIVQRVHDKTSGRLGDLETIIKQTGLNVGELKKQAMEAQPLKQKHGHAQAQGGPYMPEDILNAAPGAKTMLSELDNFVLLSHIVDTLPLATPIDDGEEQSPFGRRIDPLNGHMAFHSGLDISGPTGSKIYVTADGKIISAGRSGAYGNAIDVDHGAGVVTRYAHLSEILVHEGQSVRKGDQIGVQGSTGRSTGAHLHYEVRYHDQPMNPKKFLEAGLHVPQD